MTTGNSGTWEFPRAKPLAKHAKTLVMGIVNLTPDSFSGGGAPPPSPREASDRALALIDAGADIVDFGAESTRPGAAVLTAEEEINRLGDVVALTRSRSDVPISVDTYHTESTRLVLDQGADILNDVSALRLGWDGEAGRRDNVELAALIASHGAHIILTHMPASPAAMQASPRYDDVCREVGDFLLDRAAFAEKMSIKRDRIWLDPGFGFGKTFAHNRTLLLDLDRLSAGGYAVAVGLSRKRMINDALGLPVDQRTEASIALAVMATMKGAALIRVHDVKETVRAIGMVDAIRNGII